ncbi:hypothetical protein HC02_24800 [Vibrio parahaemolyticus]|nr:hypothetical protein HC02_24800 [Vibrio parahaemolyticus]
MMETVFTELEAASALFTVAEPKPVAHVDILAGGRLALEEATFPLVWHSQKMKLITWWRISLS